MIKFLKMILIFFFALCVLMFKFMLMSVNVLLFFPRETRKKKENAKQNTKNKRRTKINWLENFPKNIHTQNKK